MDISLISSLSEISPSFYPSSLSSPFSSQLSLQPNAFKLWRFSPNIASQSKIFLRKSLLSCQKDRVVRAAQSFNEAQNDGFVLEDVPHLTDFLPDLQSHPNPLQKSQAYAIVKKTFVSPEDVVAQNIVIQKTSPGGVHFRRAGPPEKVYFKSDDVSACIVTCGGLCPGINTVIREIVCGLNYMYGVEDILGIEGGYRGFYSKNTLKLSPKVVNDIHKRGRTFLRTSRGGHDTHKIVDNIQDRGINQVYIIGGDGTQKGAALIYEEIKNRGLHVAVAGIPKTIDNDIAVKELGRAVCRGEVVLSNLLKRDGSYVNELGKTLADKISENLTQDQEGAVTLGVHSKIYAQPDDSIGKVFGPKHSGCVQGLRIGVSSSSVFNLLGQILSSMTNASSNTINEDHNGDLRSQVKALEEKLVGYEKTKEELSMLYKFLQGKFGFDLPTIGTDVPQP